MVWDGSGVYDSNSYDTDYDIYLYDGRGETIPLTTDIDGSWDEYPQINDRGQVVWQGDDGIWLYSRGKRGIVLIPGMN